MNVMKKQYTYKNAIIRVLIPDDGPSNIRKSTEEFLRKVLKERMNNGNLNKSGIIKK